MYTNDVKLAGEGRSELCVVPVGRVLKTTESAVTHS